MIYGTAVQGCSVGQLTGPPAHYDTKSCLNLSVTVSHVLMSLTSLLMTSNEVSVCYYKLCKAPQTTR